MLRRSAAHLLRQVVRNSALQQQEAHLIAAACTPLLSAINYSSHLEQQHSFSTRQLIYKNSSAFRTFSSASVPEPTTTQQTNPTTTPKLKKSGHRLAAVLPSTQTLPAQNVRVEATYVGSAINIYDLMARPECHDHYKRLHKGTVILSLDQNNGDISEAMEADGMPLGPYLVATTYGSAVFFNVEPDQKEEWLTVLRNVAAEPAPLGDKRYNEEYSVAVVSELPAWSQLEPECIRLKTLDLRNMQVIAQVLAQSVALDFYSAHVERTIETFCSMNLEMAESASIAGVDKQVLLRLVAENNIVMTEIISKLGVHERYDIAWKYVQYGRIWEFLRSELEMEPRFKTLDMKLNLIQDNLKYFLEILQARKSDSLEWTIIILIAVEIVLSLYELKLGWL
jgi:uncharacterized Rmd1/YagE family protein